VATTEEDPPLRVVGMGPFPLPGEKARHRKALAEVRRLLQPAEAIDQCPAIADPEHEES
jgi:hypothetical protein